MELVYKFKPTSSVPEPLDGKTEAERINDAASVETKPRPKADGAAVFFPSLRPGQKKRRESRRGGGNYLITRIKNKHARSAGAGLGRAHAAGGGRGKLLQRA